MGFSIRFLTFLSGVAFVALFFAAYRSFISWESVAVVQTAYLICAGGVLSRSFSRLRKGVERREFTQGGILDACAILQEVEKLHKDIFSELAHIKRERTEAHEELGYYVSQLDNINVAIFRTDLNGAVLRANKMCLSILKVDDFEEVKRMGAWSVYYDPEDRHKMLRLLHAQGSVENFEFKYKNSKGECGWALLFAQLLRNQQGEPLCLDGIIYDITEEKLARQRLIASERLAAVGTLAGGVAHEFNNINTGVLGYAELALQEEGLSEKMAYYFASIRSFSLRSKELTKNLLSFTSQKANGMCLGGVNDVLRQTVSLLESELIGDKVDLQVSYGDVGTIMMNRGQISQVIINLFINARHALLKSSVRKITVETGSLDGYAYVSVCDTGCGICEEDQSKVFTPFFSTKGEYSVGESVFSQVDGTGLGLSVCDTIVKNHGGYIELRSDEHKGSTFIIYLPLVEEKSMSQSIAEEKGGACSSGEGRIMILDDEKDICDLIKYMLEDVGYEVLVSDDGHEVLENLEAYNLDLLIVDLQMPKMSGPECIKRIVELPEEVRPAILILTGKMLDSVQEYIKDLEYVDIISKPFEMSEFQLHIGKLMEKIRPCAKDLGV